MFPVNRHASGLVPPTEIAGRIEDLQQALAGMDVAGAWISHMVDRFYFSGSAQDGVLLIPAVGEAVFHVRRSRARAAAESPLRVEPYPGRKGMIAAAQAMLGAGGRLGVSLDVLPAATYVWLCDALPGCPLIDIAGHLRLQKAVKSAWEIEQIRGAAEQASRALAEVAELAAPGMTELELSAVIEQRLRSRGHSGTLRVRRIGVDLVILYAVAGDGGLYATNFDGPVGGEGPSPAAAAGSGWKRLAAGETLMVDMSTNRSGYHADNARTYFLGAAAPEPARAAHAFCLEALARIEEGLRPGTVCADLYERVSAWAADQGEPQGFMGFGENRVRFFGHGIGLELDEFPVIAGRLELALSSGMVVAVEPKAFLEGIGPVGIENTYVITPAGCESLCTAEREIVPITGPAPRTRRS